MATRVKDITGDRWIEVEVFNDNSPDSVFIQADGGFCMEFSREQIYAALTIAFGTGISVAAGAESFLMGLVTSM